MNKITCALLIAASASIISCNKDDNDFIVPPPSEGQTTTFNGGAGGANAVNATYIDFSADKADSVKRASWDLGFYSGADFRVVLNNTTSAAVKVLTANSLAAVGAADTIGLTLAIDQVAPAASDYAYFDAINGSITGTAIPAVSATATDNKVIILNRGTGGATPARPWIKLRVTRNANGGYTLQWARILETTTFNTIEVSKDAAYNFRFVSLDGAGSIVKVEPKKAEWDMTWGYSVFQTSFGAGLVPYNFSDLIAINTLAEVKAVQKVYASATVRNDAFTAFNKDSVANSTFSNDRWTIGNNWRSTQPATGVRTDRFYVIKDGADNYYKVKFVSMGSNDGGERGKPVFEYKLIK